MAFNNNDYVLPLAQQPSSEGPELESVGVSLTACIETLPIDPLQLLLSEGMAYIACTFANHVYQRSFCFFIVKFISIKFSL